jgi:hypothetical protein
MCYTIKILKIRLLLITKEHTTAILKSKVEFSFYKAYNKHTDVCHIVYSDLKAFTGSNLDAFIAGNTPAKRERPTDVIHTVIMLSAINIGAL